MFSSRTPEELTPNRLTQALNAARARGRTILDLTDSNPTRAGFEYPSDLFRLLADIRGLRYAPAPFGLPEALAAVHDLALVADEVFAEYELTPGAGVAAGRVMERNDILTFSLGGLSKSVGLPQAKLAWIAVAGPDRLVGPALDRLELICDTY